jgi:hypothetical protein
MKKSLLPFVGKNVILAASLLLLIAATVATVISLQPAKPGPRVVLADSAEFLAVGLGFSPDAYHALPFVQGVPPENRTAMLSESTPLSPSARIQFNES